MVSSNSMFVHDCWHVAENRWNGHFALSAVQAKITESLAAVRDWPYNMTRLEDPLEGWIMAFPVERGAAVYSARCSVCYQKGEWWPSVLCIELPTTMQ